MRALGHPRDHVGSGRVRCRDDETLDNEDSNEDKKEAKAEGGGEEEEEEAAAALLLKRQPNTIVVPTSYHGTALLPRLRACCMVQGHGFGW